MNKKKEAKRKTGIRKGKTACALKMKGEIGKFQPVTGLDFDCITDLILLPSKTLEFSLTRISQHPHHFKTLLQGYSQHRFQIFKSWV